MGNNKHIKQHQPLRKPQGWTGQDATLIMQLEGLFNDVYRQLGLLEEKTESLDERVTALEE